MSYLYVSNYSGQESKEKTLELYHSLPKDKSERMKLLDVRDHIIELNYKFFEYVAAHTYVKNYSIEHEDKVQTCILSFCKCWWWYLWDGTGDDKHKGYRQDLAFTTFFKPRLSEMIDRELTEVKYHVYRPLLMKVGDQLGKHWNKVEYDDLAKVELSTEDLNSLKAIFGANYLEPIEDFMFESAEYEDTNSLSSILDDDKYDSLEDFLIREIISAEDKLTDKDLESYVEIYGFDYDELVRTLPKAYDKLKAQLESKMDIQDMFMNM